MTDQYMSIPVEEFERLHEQIRSLQQAHDALLVQNGALLARLRTIHTLAWDIANAANA